MFSKLAASSAASSAATEGSAATGATSRVTGQGSDLQQVSAAIERLIKKREVEELKEAFTEREQMLENVKLRQEELQKSMEITGKNYSYEVPEPRNILERAEKEMNSVLELEAELERLKEECTRLMTRKKELQSQLEKCSPYSDFLERACRLMQLKEADEFIAHYQRMLCIRDRLFRSREQMEEQRDQQKKELLALEEQHKLLWVQKNHKLSQLQTELGRTHSEALIWQQRWDCIQKMDAKKALELSEIKVSVYNLYEMAGEVIRLKHVDYDDSVEQLEQVRKFILEDSDIMKEYQLSLEEPTVSMKAKPKLKVQKRV